MGSGPNCKSIIVWGELLSVLGYKKRVMVMGG